MRYVLYTFFLVSHIFGLISPQWRSCVLPVSRSTTCSTQLIRQRPAWSLCWRGNFTSCLHSTFPVTNAFHSGMGTLPSWVSAPGQKPQQYRFSQHSGIHLTAELSNDGQNLGSPAWTLRVKRGKHPWTPETLIVVVLLVVFVFFTTGACCKTHVPSSTLGVHVHRVDIVLKEK